MVFLTLPDSTGHAKYYEFWTNAGRQHVFLSSTSNCNQITHLSKMMRNISIHMCSRVRTNQSVKHFRQVLSIIKCLIRSHAKWVRAKWKKNCIQFTPIKQYHTNQFNQPQNGFHFFHHATKIMFVLVSFFPVILFHDWRCVCLTILSSYIMVRRDVMEFDMWEDNGKKGVDVVKELGAPKGGKRVQRGRHR